MDGVGSYPAGSHGQDHRGGTGNDIATGPYPFFGSFAGLRIGDDGVCPVDGYLPIEIRWQDHLPTVLVGQAIDFHLIENHRVRSIRSHKSCNPVGRTSRAADMGSRP